MRPLPTPRLLPGVLLFALAALVLTPFTPPADARAADKTDRAAGTPARPVSYLRDVRPILAQHCFGCHGPDEAARKGKLRLDLKSAAFAVRKGRHVVAAGDPGGSLVFERLVTDDEGKRMPPEGSPPLTEKQVGTIRAWIEQGAAWEDHWSFLPPVKPQVPAVADKGWVRDPLDAFVLARLEKEGLKPESEATREAWLRRASFDLTGLPPTPAEIDDFLKDRSADAYGKQADRLLKSPRYGERQAQEWLDLARYADTSGYQSDMPRKVWKWREWVINAYNANMPFDQFTIEQLAGDLLPDATLAQKIATGFNRNHPTNSEAGEEEDEYRSVYVIDRVGTTATVFMGLTMACAQCHDHKYDPVSQKDFYSFYSFFNNIKERDSDFGTGKPSIPVPNPDQEPRLADLKTRIDTLKQRIDRDDPLTDAAQKEWEKKALAAVGKPVEWVAVRPAAMFSRNGSLLRQLDDGSVLSAGTAPVKDTYDLMLRPGKKAIAALRLEVLPDDSHPFGALGRAADGRFNLSAVEIRHTTLGDSQEPPLVFIARAEADINQKVKEEAFAFDMFPGSIESAITLDPIVGDGFRGGGWSIIGEERKKRHEAVFLPVEPIETNEASVIRIGLHQTGGRFKSLIGRFRLSYTEDTRVRDVLMPAQPKLWSAIGPFPAEDAAKVYGTAFDPEKDVKGGSLDLKKSYPRVVLPPPPEGKGDAPMGGFGGKGKFGAKTEGPPAKAATEPEKAPAPKAKDEAKAVPPIPKATDEPAKKADKKDAATKDDTAAKKPKGEQPKVTWAEQRWRDGSPARPQGGTGHHAFYVTRKVTSTQARTATVQLAGPAGHKLWVNGELVHSSTPPPPPPPPSPTPPPKKDVKPGDDEPPAPEEPDIEAIMNRRRNQPESPKFRIGLRQGENEIVVKLVFAGPAQNTGRPGGPMPTPSGPPGTFTFNLTPEGDDVVTHEVATVLRLEAQERTRLKAEVPTAPTPRPAAQPPAAAPGAGTNREADTR